jgi:hypothetical protein
MKRLGIIMKFKDLENNKIIKVQCSFCGKDMECPEDMLATSKRHMCYECFQKSDTITDKDLKNIHVDIPMDEFSDVIAENFAEDMIDEVFPKLWPEKKRDFKELSKKDLSREMFGAGVYLGIQAFMDLMRDGEKNK